MTARLVQLTASQTRLLRAELETLQAIALTAADRHDKQTAVKLPSNFASMMRARASVLADILEKL
jgi:hypothetical protein